MARAVHFSVECRQSFFVVAVPESMCATVCCILSGKLSFLSGAAAFLELQVIAAIRPFRRKPSESPVWPRYFRRSCIYSQVSGRGRLVTVPSLSLPREFAIDFFLLVLATTATTTAVAAAEKDLKRRRVGVLGVSGENSQPPTNPVLGC